MHTKVVQYLPLTHLNAALKYYENLNKNKVEVIFDLEDSAQDIFNYKNTIHIKDVARLNFEKIINKINKKEDCFYYLRINNPHTVFFNEDVKVIKKISNKNLMGIYLPKVEEYTDIEKCSKKLNFIKNLKIIPIIETVKGMKNLNKTLDNDKGKLNCINEIHFGHFDYFLDKNQWPFPDPFHHNFWYEVNFLINIINKHNKIYVHTPYPFIKNKTLFWLISDHIKENYPNLNFKMSSINYSISISKPTANKTKLKIKNISTSKEYHRFYAKRIINYFIKNQSNKRSFAVTSKRFIAPHQYLMAKKFLKND